MNPTVNQFREGIFAFHTVRFGQVAELMVQELYGMDPANNNAFDRLYNGERIEIKFSRVLQENSAKIRLNNVLELCLNNTSGRRGILYEDTHKPAFDCNIQQVKPIEFDWLYYGLFFMDKILIFKIPSSEIHTLPNCSAKQHRGNMGEGQFHIVNSNLEYHIEHYLDRIITYEELYNLFLR